MMKHPIPRPQNELEAELYWGIFSSDPNLSIQGGTSQEGKNHLIYIGSGPSQGWLLNTVVKYLWDSSYLCVQVYFKQGLTIITFLQNIVQQQCHRWFRMLTPGRILCSRTHLTDHLWSRRTHLSESVNIMHTSAHVQTSTDIHKHTSCLSKNIMHKSLYEHKQAHI